MGDIDESIREIDNLLNGFQEKKNNLEEIIDKKIEKLLAKKNLKKDENVEYIALIKAEMTEKYKGLIEENIEKLQNSKKTLGDLKEKYRYLLES